MELSVILGAVVMLIGVLAGYAIANVSLQGRKSPSEVVTQNVYNPLTPNDVRQAMGLSPHVNPTTSFDILDLVSVKERDQVKKNLERVLELLREHTGPIPVEVGDEIEELVENVLNRMNPTPNN